MNGANGMSDIEGKAAKGAATELGREGVSIMKDEVRFLQQSLILFLLGLHKDRSVTPPSCISILAHSKLASSSPRSIFCESLALVIESTGMETCIADAEAV